MPETTIDEELINRLKKRIQELEDEQSRLAADDKSKHGSGEKVLHAIKESIRKNQIENAKLFRGFSEAGLEILSGSVRPLSEFLDGVTQRERIKEGASISELSGHFLEDLAEGFARAIESAAESRSRT